MCNRHIAWLYGNQYFSAAGPREWNNLPLSIRQSPTVNSFISSLKTRLFKIAYKCQWRLPFLSLSFLSIYELWYTSSILLAYTTILGFSKNFYPRFVLYKLAVCFTLFSTCSRTYILYGMCTVTKCIIAMVNGTFCYYSVLLLLLLLWCDGRHLAVWYGNDYTDVYCSIWHWSMQHMCWSLYVQNIENLCWHDKHMKIYGNLKDWQWPVQHMPGSICRVYYFRCCLVDLHSGILIFNIHPVIVQCRTKLVIYLPNRNLTNSNFESQIIPNEKSQKRNQRFSSKV